MSNLEEKGKEILEAIALAGQKESLIKDIKALNAATASNNASVAELQETVDASNKENASAISGLVKELDGVTNQLSTRLAALKKEGYTLPIGSKSSKTTAL